jgi:hypothetical protein
MYAQRLTDFRLYTAADRTVSDRRSGCLRDAHSSRDHRD